SWKESFIDIVAREGTELEAVLIELEITRFKRVASKDDKVRRSQVNRRMAAKMSDLMEEKMSTPELNAPLKLARLNEMLEGPVDMATISSTVVQNLAKRKAVKRGLLLVQLRQTVWTITLEENLTREREAFQLKQEKEREAAALKLKDVRAESVAKAERLVTVSASSQNNLVGKLYLLRYTKAKIMAFSEGNYEEKEIMDKEEVEEMEVGLTVTEKTAVDNQETINQEIESSRLRVVDLEGLLEVEKKSIAELQYEDQLDDNVKLSLKLEEAKRQVEDKTATILSRD
ncbi:hypothetical protein GIB67_018046, partial [Kingdonia uniflora]